LKHGLQNDLIDGEQGDNSRMQLAQGQPALILGSVPEDQHRAHRAKKIIPGE
jgi:hypothetical protein